MTGFGESFLLLESTDVLKLTTPLATSWLYCRTFSSFVTSDGLAGLEVVGGAERFDLRCCFEHSLLV